MTFTTLTVQELTNHLQNQYDIIQRQILSTDDQGLQDELIEKQDMICAEADRQGVQILY